ncbi:MAG: hypothetical protein F6J86_18455 [Symploca sp. SIO1B1]|nr:hypothetical protein [Symploca sp. SIO1B1]
MFSYKRFSFFLGLNLMASTVVSVNQVQAQSLTANELDAPQISQSTSGAGSSSQSNVDANSSSNLDNGSKANHKDFQDKLGEKEELSTFPSSTKDILNNLGAPLEFSASVITEVEKEHNPETSKPQVNEPQEQNNSETSASPLVEENQGSILKKSTPLSSGVINNSPTESSPSLVIEPKTEKITESSSSLVIETKTERIPESSPSLFVWLGLAGVGLLHASVRRQKVEPILNPSKEGNRK